LKGKTAPSPTLPQNREGSLVSEALKSLFLMNIHYDFAVAI
jgi:hypothetical protein